MSPDDFQPRRREPVLSAPWPPLLLGLLLVALYATQGVWGGPFVYDMYALIPARVTAGEGGGLLTHLFLHGSWAHVLMNAAGLLAFGAGVLNLLGRGARGVTAFSLFYLACGLVAGAAFVALQPTADYPVVGASGAVSGLMGAASRLIERPGVLSGFRSPPAVAMAAAFGVINLAAAMFGTLPGAGGASIAWEAHLAGYVAGLLLIGPVARLARAKAH